MTIQELLKKTTDILELPVEKSQEFAEELQRAVTVAASTVMPPLEEVKAIEKTLEQMQGAWEASTDARDAIVIRLQAVIDESGAKLEPDQVAKLTTLVREFSQLA